MLSEGEGTLMQTQVERMVKADAALTEGRLSVAVVTSEPGFAGPPAHRHLRNDEAFYILEGEFAFSVDDEVVSAGPGAFLFVPVGAVHAFVNRGRSRGRMLEIFSPADFEGYFEELASLRSAGDLTRERISALQERYGMEVVGPATGTEGLAMPGTHSMAWFGLADRKPAVLQVGEGRVISTRAERTVKADSRMTEGRFSLHVVSCEAGYQGPPLHIHQRTDEAFFVLEGSLRFRVGEETVSVGPGGFVFVPAGTAHSFANDSDAASRHIELFAPGDFEAYFFERAALQAQAKLGANEREALLEKYGMVVVGPPLGAGG